MTATCIPHHIELSRATDQCMEVNKSLSIELQKDHDIILQKLPDLVILKILETIRLEGIRQVSSEEFDDMFASQITRINDLLTELTDGMPDALQLSNHDPSERMSRQDGSLGTGEANLVSDFLWEL